MNDTPVSRAIHSTHFAIISVFVFIFLLVGLFYLWLCNGIALKRLDLPAATIEKLYIKWDKTLTVTAQTVRLLGDTKGSKTDLSALHDTFVTVVSHLDDRWLGTFRIDRLITEDGNLSIDYAPSTGGHILWRSASGDANVTLGPPSERHLHFFIDADNAPLHAQLRSEGNLSLARGTIRAAGRITVTSDIALKFSASALEKRFDVDFASIEPFKNIASLITPFNLDPTITQWIVTRLLKNGPMTLHTLHTSVPYDDPTRGFANLYAHLTVTDVRYNFTPDTTSFEPVKAPKVELFFDDKKLFIVPIDATFYGQSGDGTWLDIDFAPQAAELHLFIDTRARFTSELRRLVKAYGIELPFLQHAGRTLARLDIRIVLPTLDVNDSGRFYLRDSRIDYNGLALDVNDTFFTLEGTRIALRRMHASLEKRSVAFSVSGYLDPVAEKGRLDFTVIRARLQTDPAIALAKTPWRFRYEIRPKRDRVHCIPSHWYVDDKRFEVTGFSAPFSYHELTLKLPRTHVESPPWFEADVAGTINLKAMKASLEARLQTFAVEGFRNARRSIVFAIDYDDGLTVATREPTRWQVGDTNVSVGPLQIVSTPDRLLLKPTRLHVEHLVEGTIEGVFDPKTYAATLNVEAMRFVNDAFSKLFHRFEALKVYIVPENGEFDVIVPELNMRFSTLGQGWKLHFFSLDTFVEDSPLLQEYNITHGAFTAWSNTGEFPFDFNGTLDYPYAILHHGGKPVSTYRLHGRFDAPDKAHLFLNDHVKIYIDGDINISASDVVFDFSEMLRFYEDHTSEAAEKNATVAMVLPVIRLDAHRTAVVFDDRRRAPADRLSLLYRNGHVTAQLFKQNGGALLEAENGRFYLYGNNLDDDFMNQFFKLSHFKGGRLDFYVIGEAKAFDGLIVVSDTTIYDYVLLNNLFAFMNTVPALVTFSLPSYESKGIEIIQAYANLHFHDGLLNIDGIKVDSKEMDFAGMGTVDYNSRNITMELSVKTQAGANIRKFPIVGYILVGDDHSVLTTVKIDGPIDNPKVTNTMAKDIVVAPFNLLKRAFNFPLHYLELFEKNIKSGVPSRRMKNKHNPHRITSGIPLEPGKE